jgi:hypothetical protein
MQAVIIIIFAVVALGVFFMRQAGYEDKIYKEIESMGGTVISIEKRNFFTGIGPFMVVGKGRTVYRIDYQAGDAVKEGWVRFGGLLGPDWRL